MRAWIGVVGTALGALVRVIGAWFIQSGADRRQRQREASRWRPEDQLRWLERKQGPYEAMVAVFIVLAETVPGYVLHPAIPARYMGTAAHQRFRGRIQAARRAWGPAIKEIGATRRPAMPSISLIVGGC